MKQSRPLQPDASTFTSTGAKASGLAQVSFSPPQCKSDLTEEALDQAPSLRRTWRLLKLSCLFLLWLVCGFISCAAFMAQV